MTWVGNRSCGDRASNMDSLIRLAMFYLKAHNQAQVYLDRNEKVRHVNEVRKTGSGVVGPHWAAGQGFGGNGRTRVRGRMTPMRKSRAVTATRSMLNVWLQTHDLSHWLYFVRTNVFHLWHIVEKTNADRCQTQSQREVEGDSPKAFL